MPRKTAKKKKQPAKNPGDMTIAQLRAYAKKAQIRLPKDAKTKSEIISTIEQSSGFPAYSAPLPPPPRTVSGRTATKMVGRRRRRSVAAAAPPSYYPPPPPLPPSYPSANPSSPPRPMVVTGVTPTLPSRSNPSPIPPTVPVTVTMERSAAEPSKIKIDVYKPTGEGYITQLHYAAAKAGTEMIIDTKCSPVTTKDIYAITGKNSAIVQACEEQQESEGSRKTMECGNKILYLEILSSATGQREWSDRLTLYTRLHNLAVLHKNTLPVVSSWLCDSSKFDYYVGGNWLGSLWSRQSKGSSLTAFCMADIKGYQLLTLRNFMRSYTDPYRSSWLGLRTLYNVASTAWSWHIVEKRYEESGIIELIKNMMVAGVVPNQISPESFGVLIKTDKNIKGDDIVPVLLPIPHEMVRGPDVNSVAHDALLLAIRSKIFDSVISGFTVDGAASVYKPSRNILKKLAWGIGTAVAVGGIAYTGASLLTYMGYMPGVADTAGQTLSGSFTTVNKFLSDAATAVTEKSTQIGANAAESISKVFNTAYNNVASYMNPPAALTKITSTTPTIIPLAAANSTLPIMESSWGIPPANVPPYENSGIFFGQQ